MPQNDTTPQEATLISNGSIDSNAWTILAKDTEALPKNIEFTIVPAQLWLDNRAALVNQANCAVWLDSDQSPALIADDLSKFAFVAINFPVFADGRGYSYARELRQKHEYSGEIRAIGDVLPDQLLYLKRCGFDAFELRGDRDAEQALSRFKDFSEFYQASTDQELPLFSRRS